MKDKILIFIIGLLLGAIIATSGLLIYTKMTINNLDNHNMMKINEDGQKREPGQENIGEPPEKPEEKNDIK